MLLRGIARLCHRVQAKKRVFEIQQARAAAAKGKRKRELREDLAMAARSNEAVEVVPSLEPLPKWALVQNILEARSLWQPSHVSAGFRKISLRPTDLCMQTCVIWESKREVHSPAGACYRSFMRLPGCENVIDVNLSRELKAS